ncbi:protein SERAC1 [Cydia splendana]|uniref:protein SERAC1 n=1 Tax=Cydia splendana TaxID=1100963 RepID=UPI002144263B
MNMHDRIKIVLKILKFSSFFGCSGFLVAYPFRQTYKSIGKIVNSNVLLMEKKHTPEYIYIDDPSYDLTVRMEEDKANRQSVGWNRIWKSLQHSLAWRLLWLCKHGNQEQRNIALVQLASFNNNKEWDCLKLAQAIDKNTAVLLARTRGADLRYFLPPPIHVRKAAKAPELLSYKFHDLILAVQNLQHHSCIQHFLSKYFANVQEQAMESDSIPAKPDTLSERDLCLMCLEALHHHLSLFNNKNYEDDHSAKLLANMGIMSCIAELLLRHPNDVDVDLAVLKVLTVLSVHTSLLTAFFENGLIRELSRLLHTGDIRLSSSAAVCLANLSGEYCYRPGLYLLHPLYRNTETPICDTLLVHGLRGGVFVTWRQRDQSCKPLGILEGTFADLECGDAVPSYIDQELQQVMEEIIELEDEALLANIEVVLEDLPIDSKRDHASASFYTVKNKRIGLIQERQDRCVYTSCWPKDWLPQDCNNLRIIGVNYLSSLSDWLERCPLQASDISARASELQPNLLDAGVGSRNTPIVWLAHSMGGLIVKQVLNVAAQSQDPQANKLCECTKAVFFYSTPHKGSAFATMPRAAAAVLWPSTDVRQLQENSPVLLDIHQLFLKYADRYNWETISFAESLPTLVTAFKVPVKFVEAESADLGRGPFYKLPVDHLCICKPATRQSILYTILLDVLLRVTNKDATLKYTSIEWLFNKLFVILQSKKVEIMKAFNGSQSNEGIRWSERVLLDIFTDGFTD